MTGPFGTNLSRKDFTESGVPLLTISCLQDTGIKLEKAVFVSKEKAEELERYQLQSGDLLFSRMASVGRAGIVGKSLYGALFNYHIMRLRLDPNVLLAKFFMAYVRGSAQVEDYLREVNHGATRAGINTEQLLNMPVALPPLADQKRIVEEVERRLSVIDELESVVKSNLQRATRLRQSILQWAFAGELVTTVPASQISDIIPSFKPEHLQQPNSHFARALLSAEIVHRLHIEPTFGRIKHQKIFHLCEHIAQIEEIHGQYHREAAGPLDNKLIYANEAELKKQKWYQEVRRESYGHAYQALDKAGGHRKYVERYWVDKLPTIEKLIELMRKWDTERCEIFCTAYAAWNDLIIWKKEPTEKAILHEILERWNDSKKRFPKDRWSKAIQWMRDKGYVPTGFGKPTNTPE